MHLIRSGKRAVVTGATGMLGSNLSIALLAAGHSVTATRRTGSRVDHLDGHAVDWVDADLGDPAALTRAFTGADVVFHCAAHVSIRRRPTPALVAANVEGTRHVLQAVRAARVPRLVHCSTAGAVGLSVDGAPCDESASWNFGDYGLADGYVTTKRRAEELVLADDDVDAVVVNPTYMFGPYDPKPSSGQLIVKVVRGTAPGWTPGLNNFVDARDVARGMLLAWEKGRRGERYILGGENMSYREVFARIARVAEVVPPMRRVPRPVARLLGWAGDLQETLAGSEPLLNSSTIGFAYCERYHFTSEKARGELGYSPGPIEPAITDAIAWFRARGML